MKLRRLNSSSGSIGCGVVALAPRGIRRRARPAEPRPPDVGRAPAQLGLADQRERGPGERRGRQQPRPASRPAAARRAAAARGTATRTSTIMTSDERRVDREDPPPRCGVDQLPADQRPDHRPRCPTTPARTRPPHRAAPGGNAVTITANALGVSSAPNTPWSTRPATSTSIARRECAQRSTPAEPEDADREHPPLAVHVAQRPAHEDQRRRAPAGIRSTPTADPQGHRRDPPRSPGSATLTTVASSPTTNEPMIAANRLRRCARSTETIPSCES